MKIAIYDASEGGKLTLEYFKDVLSGHDYVYLDDSKNAPLCESNDKKLATIYEDVKKQVEKGKFDLLIISNLVLGIYLDSKNLKFDVKTINVLDQHRAAAENVNKSFILSHGYVIESGVLETIFPEAKTIDAFEFKEGIVKHDIKTIASWMTKYAEKLIVPGCSEFIFLNKKMKKFLNPWTNIELEADLNSPTNVETIKL